LKLVTLKPSCSFRNRWCCFFEKLKEVTEIIIESKFGDVRKYLVKLSSQILVQENDFVRAGVPLSDGAITPEDILRIKGPAAVQQYLVNEIQEVYRFKGEN
jgi:DNA-directed RNA polymerase subunit beta'